MISKEEAVALIGERLEKQPRLVVALDGMSCSGKTTFAQPTEGMPKTHHWPSLFMV